MDPPDSDQEEQIAPKTLPSEDIKSDLTTVKVLLTRGEKRKWATLHLSKAFPAKGEAKTDCGKALLQGRGNWSAYDVVWPDLSSIQFDGLCTKLGCKAAFHDFYHKYTVESSDSSDSSTC